MTNLANPVLLDQFVARLERAERFWDMLSLYDAKFIGEMRDRFESREQSEDLGVQPWSPSAKQWNYLISITESLR